MKTLFDNQKTIQDRFDDFHRDHPDVYQELARLARILKSKGRTHYSIDALMHVVRWNYVISGEPSEDWKLNNDFSSRYARLLMEQEQDLTGFFELRRLKAS